MKVTKVLAVLGAIKKWHEGEAPISDVCHELGDEHNEVGSMLVANAIADFSYKCMPDFSYQEVVNAILLYLAMVQGRKVQKE